MGRKKNLVIDDDEYLNKNKVVITDENVEEDEGGMRCVVGKQKFLKGFKKTDSLSNALLLEEDGEVGGFHSVSKIECDGVVDVAIVFSGKKKSSKKKGFAALVDDAVAEVEPIVASVSSMNVSAEVDGFVSEEKHSTTMLETLKKKKKNKWDRKTTEEQNDLDKILAELGEGPVVSSSTPPPQVDTRMESSGLTGGKDGEDKGIAESVAAKKKKKKKEKEKEKKVAATEKKEEAKSETKSKVAEKKLPKHVKKMQEVLARRKEAKEKKRREEEDRLRKEEEEQRKHEELLRQAEEAKLRRKEKQKEKLRQKREAGLPLTPKQKDEHRRREIMKNQFLASAGNKLLASDDGAPAKRPAYASKKSKSNRLTNGLTAQTLDEMETKQDFEMEKGEVCTMNVEKGKVSDVIEKSTDVGEAEDGEDWDAKSWDGTNLALSNKCVFGDEEADSEPQSSAKEEGKQTSNSVCDTSLPSSGVKSGAAAKEAISSQPIKSQIVGISDFEAVLKKINKEAKVQNEKPISEIEKSERNLRSPICCVMGHVDTGKTKLLDCIRGTNIQEGEAGGITQQIGATYFPAENIRERTKKLEADAKLNVPGLLVVDTPGHESFVNLRTRGFGLCDIAILVVDIMHGLEPQIIESLDLLKMRNTEFIVALNKVDRLYGWKTCRNSPIQKALEQQNKEVQDEFNMRLMQIITQFKTHGLNTERYYENKEMGETFNIVPTSAISGEGIPDLLLLLVQQSQKTLFEKLTFSNKVQCTVLDVKAVEGHGTTIDVVLVNGVLCEGDQIVVCGMQGPISTTIRALLVPHPMKELRVKGTYLHHKEVKAAQAIKITAQGLEHAIAGSALYVVGPDDDIEKLEKSAMEDMDSVLSRVDKSGEGVYVQASGLGSLEALLNFLESPAVNIPVSGINVGAAVHKKDVMKASVMLEKKKEFATILAFDVKVTPEAREYADKAGVKIFMAEIIYHLFDQFKAYIDEIKEERKRDAAEDAVFPCVLKIVPSCIFNKKDPIILGVQVYDGNVKMGTPLCIPSQGFIDIGRVASIENNHKPVDSAKKGQQVALKIVGSNPEEQQKMFGRHFDSDDELVSHISRKSVDVLEANYKNDVSSDDKKLLRKLKKLFKIH